MTGLSRNTRRRLALYGGAALVAALALGVPPLVKSRAPRVSVPEFDIGELRSREATRLLREYVRIDSSNPPGRTVETARFWAEKLGCEGIPFEIVGSDPEHPIVVARLAGRRRGEALLLLHHMDVYPVGDLSKWDHPPFGAVDGTGMLGNYICGRGTIDMKGQGSPTSSRSPPSAAMDSPRSGTWCSSLNRGKRRTRPRSESAGFSRTARTSSRASRTYSTRGASTRSRATGSPGSGSRFCRSRPSWPGPRRPARRT
ncbi:MAG: M20/M25/M40 family metallo-hydrolase [Holophagales bacterium]|nr:M20/M25/M40 family metallo-hydrolase [Holophagales bacterium]